MTDTAERLNTALAGRYTIEREIGQGGMATVFLARDLRHDRRVALKLLRADLGAVVGIERFLAEIRVTANLQHPNLLPLFDSGGTDGTLFYVMPFVDGESLRHRLDREKQLPVEEAVRITVAVAAALDYAHKQGVIHRDLKPENILMQAGQPVVADFGIALAISNAGGTRVTQTGLSLGTPQYMSPEQATGDRVIDARTDIYSLAAVLYEMLTGEPPHTGSTAQAIISRMLTERPRSVRLTRPSIPLHVEASVERALEKLPADRFATAGEFAEALTRPELLKTQRTAAHAPMTTARRAAIIVPWFLLGFGAAIALPRLLRESDSPDPIVRYAVRLDDVRLRNDASPALSPDGSMIAYPGVDSTRAIRLYVQSLDRAQPIPVGTDAYDPNSPFFSADGRHIGFVRQGRLWKVALAGGTSQPICDLQGAWQLGSWSVNDDIVFGRLGSLYRVRSEGGQPQLLVERDSAAGVIHYGAPHFLPDGKVLLAERQTTNGPALVSVRLADGAVTELGIAGFAPHYVDAGFLVYVDPSGTAFGVPFDAGRARVNGSPAPLAENVTRSTHARLSVSRNGTIAYLSPVGNDRREVVMVNRDGTRQTVPVPQGRYRFPRFSPDGKKLVITAQGDRGLLGDALVYELATRRADRLTFDTTTLMAEWSPDGRSIIYQGRPRGTGPRPWQITRVGADGGSAPESLYSAPELGNPAGGPGNPMLAPDLRTLVFSARTRGAGRGFDLLAISLGDTVTRVLANSADYNETAASISPDGRWVAYSANPGGTWHVYVRRLDAPSGRWQVTTTNGGTEARWATNGRELFFREGDSVHVVSFQGSTATPLIGTPRGVIEAANFISWPTETHYDVSHDGQRFVFVSGVQGGNVSLNIVLNQFDHLRSNH
jgi:eukaryotic-like serine/threonine-protein kinase